MTKEEIQNQIAALEVVKNQNLTNVSAVMFIINKIIELENQLKLIELSNPEEVNGSLEFDEYDEHQKLLIELSNLEEDNGNLESGEGEQLSS